jgi:hypothetical protein
VGLITHFLDHGGRWCIVDNLPRSPPAPSLPATTMPAGISPFGIKPQGCMIFVSIDQVPGT